MRSRGIVAVALCAATACGKHAARPDSATVTAAAAATAAAAPSDCPRTGHWTPCQVKKRLEQSGAVPRDSALSDLPTLGPRPITYALGTAGLAVYLFPDSVARGRATRRLDSTKFIPPSRDLSIRQEATAIENDNLLALLFTHRDQQRERVSDALMAGAPQP